MINGHCHLAPQGLKGYSEDEFGVPGTSEHLFNMITACGFEKAQVFAPFDNPESNKVQCRLDTGENSLDWLLQQSYVDSSEQSPLIPVAVIKPEMPDAVEKLEYAQGMGVRMLKYHPVIQRSDPRLAACKTFFARAERNAMSLVYHTGGSMWEWSYECSTPKVCSEIARDYPGIPVLMAHCGVFGDVEMFDEAVKLCKEVDNLYLDTTSALLRIGVDRWKRCVDTVGPEKIIYGNDYPFVDTKRIEAEVAFIKDLGLSESESDMVLGGNLWEMWQGSV